MRNFFVPHGSLFASHPHLIFSSFSHTHGTFMISPSSLPALTRSFCRRAAKNILAITLAAPLLLLAIVIAATGRPASLPPSILSYFETSGLTFWSDVVLSTAGIGFPSMLAVIGIWSARAWLGEILVSPARFFFLILLCAATSASASGLGYVVLGGQAYPLGGSIGDALFESTLSSVAPLIGHSSLSQSNAALLSRSFVRGLFLLACGLLLFVLCGRVRREIFDPRHYLPFIPRPRRRSPPCDPALRTEPMEAFVTIPDGDPKRSRSSRMAIDTVCDPDTGGDHGRDLPPAFPFHAPSGALIALLERPRSLTSDFATFTLGRTEQKLLAALGEIGLSVDAPFSSFHGSVLSVYEFTDIPNDLPADLQAQLQAATGINSVRVLHDSARHRLQVELPTFRPQPIDPLPLLYTHYEIFDPANLQLPFGENVAGEPVFRPISSLNSVLVMGGTVHARSNYARFLLAATAISLPSTQVRTFTIDPDRRVGITAQSGSFHELGPALFAPDQIVGAFSWLDRQIESRLDISALSSSGTRGKSDDVTNSDEAGGDLPTILVLILLPEEGAQRSFMIDHIRHIALFAPGSRIVPIVFCDAEDGAALISEDLRPSFMATFPVSGDAYRERLGFSDDIACLTSAEDFFARDPLGAVFRAHAPRISASDLSSVLRRRSDDLVIAEIDSGRHRSLSASNPAMCRST